MSNHEVTKTTVVTISVGLLLGSEILRGKHRQTGAGIHTVKCPSGVILNIRTLGHLLSNQITEAEPSAMC